MNYEVVAVIIAVSSLLLLAYATIKGSKMTAQERLYWIKQYQKSRVAEVAAQKELDRMGV